jgi:signal transduction histidine kinase
VRAVPRGYDTLEATTRPRRGRTFRSVAESLQISRTLRSWRRGLRRGLGELLVARDPPLRLDSRSARALVKLATAVGAALVVIALVGVLRAIRSPGAVAVIPSGFVVSHPKTFDVTGMFGLLLLCVRYPLVAWRIGYASVVLIPALSGGKRISLELAITLLLCFWVAGLRHGRAAGWAMCVLMLVPAWFWLGPDVGRRVEATLVLLVAAIALDATVTSRRAGHELAEQVARSEVDEARRAVLEERTRIAREMHDVVAHHMSLIAVQAETAPYRVGELSPAAREELAALSATAREALSDLRRLLGVLRSDRPAEREPQPQLADVAALVEATRRAGVNVELSMPASGGTHVSHAVGLCAYRILQEALSNAGRHAPGSGVAVTVERDSHVLRLDVVNGPPAGAPIPAKGARLGHGIAGMRERVAILGGSISAGPNDVGGFAVSAVLPLAKAATR